MNIRRIFPILAACALLFGTPADGAPRRSYTVNSYVTPKLEDLPQRAIDTLDTDDPDTKVILYSNNTWGYYRPSLQALNQLSVYREHWDTTQVFAYRSIELNDLPSVLELQLINTLSDFHYPVMGRVFSKYGPRGRRNHNGVDVPLKIGEPIYAAFDGKVRYAKYNSGGFGNLIILRHRNGLETWYAHLSRRNVEAGNYVKAGEIIGFGGSTGRSRGPHLHFEMRYADQTFDPERLIDFEDGQLRYQTFVLEKSFFNIHSRASDQLDEDDEYEGNMRLLAASEPGDSTSMDILERLMGSGTSTSGAKTASGKPASQANPGNALYHTVKSGDILGKLAIRYGVSVDQICRLNNITSKTTLNIGRRLRIK